MRFFLFLFSFHLLFANPYSYKIVEHPYHFSTYYEMQGANGFEGRAIKNTLSIKTSYDLYDSFGNHEATGAIQALSLGALFAWAKDMDIYDARGKQIGFIDGQALTTASAKYTFYDERQRAVATAYLDRSCRGFTVVSSEGNRTLAQLKRNFVENVVDDWDVTLFESGAIDLRLLKIFSAFALDHQAAFREDL